MRRWVKYYENEGMAGLEEETWEIKRFEQEQAEKEPSEP
ncbi:hypothetical protein P7H16_06960 [Paenibacillus larvae]|nr:hypothetical protein [Paenibacillus larvae]MDT2246740.1 hypothetical protein [Paenibacillus larvae]